MRFHIKSSTLLKEIIQIFICWSTFLFLFWYKICSLTITHEHLIWPHGCCLGLPTIMVLWIYAQSSWTNKLFTCSVSYHKHNYITRLLFPNIKDRPSSWFIDLFSFLYQNNITGLLLVYIVKYIRVSIIDIQRLLLEGRLCTSGVRCPFI